MSAAEASLYDATRFAWKISRAKAKQADVILATRRGLIVGAFVADDWLEATAANFPGRDDVPGRLGFVGREHRRTSRGSTSASGCRTSTAGAARPTQSSTPGAEPRRQVDGAKPGPSGPPAHTHTPARGVVAVTFTPAAMGSSRSMR